MSQPESGSATGSTSTSASATGSASAADARAYAQYLIALGDFLGTVGRLEREHSALHDRVALQRSLAQLPAARVQAIFEQLDRLAPRLRQVQAMRPDEKRDTGEALTLLGMALRRLTEP